LLAKASQKNGSQWLPTAKKSIHPRTGMTSLFVSLVSRGPNCCQLQPSRPRSQCLFFKPSAHRHPSMPGMSQSKAQTCTCQREHTPGLQSDKVSIRAHYGVCTGVTYCIFDISGMTMHLACSLVLQMNGIGLGRVCDHEKTVLVAIQCYSISLQNFAPHKQYIRSFFPRLWTLVLQCLYVWNYARWSSKPRLSEAPDDLPRSLKTINAMPANTNVVKPTATCTRPRVTTFPEGSSLEHF
jgi:hypothetical protein